MQKKIAWSSAILTALTAASAASALPAPMFEPELTEKSDVVVDVIATDIQCSDTTAESTSYKSTFATQKVYKGDAPASFDYFGILYKVPSSCGAPPAPINKGWAGKLHLVKVNGGGFTLTNYNGYEENKDISKPEPLPVCSGGEGGAGGEAGAAGAAGDAGAAGSAGSGQGGEAGSGGSGQGGEAGSAGQAGAGGEAGGAAGAAGSAGGASQAGAAGEAGKADAGGQGGTSGEAAQAEESDDGCAVSAPGGQRGWGGWLGLALGVAVAARRRR